jgi:hypothetical protein
MVAKNFQGHTGSDGSSMSDRYVRVGYQSQGMFGENVAAYSNSVWHGHCGLNVDWGTQNQIDLGHRKNIMNFENYNYTEIGIGISYTGAGIPNVGPYVITQNFGMRGQRYVVGVIFDDKNKNREFPAFAFSRPVDPITPLPQHPGAMLSRIQAHPPSRSPHPVVGYQVRCVRPCS